MTNSPKTVILRRQSCEPTKPAAAWTETLREHAGRPRQPGAGAWRLLGEAGPSGRMWQRAGVGRHHLGEGQQLEELLAAAALGERHHHVPPGHAPDVPVQRVRGAQEHGPGPRGHQRLHHRRTASAHCAGRPSSPPAGSQVVKLGTVLQGCVSTDAWTDGHAASICSGSADESAVVLTEPCRELSHVENCRQCFRR